MAGVGEYVELALFAAAMSAINLYVLARLLDPRAGPPNLARSFVVAYVLVSSGLFWVGVPWTILTGGPAGYYTLLLLMALPMPAPFLWMMAVVLRADERSIPPASLAWAVLVGASLLANEGFMSASFALLLGGSVGDLAGFVGSSLVAAWYAIPMVATMGLLLLLVPLPRFERLALGGLAATSAVSPLLLVSPLAGAIGVSIAMAIVLLVLVRELRGGVGLSPSSLRVGTAVALGLVGMAAAAAASLAIPGPGATLPFGALSFFVMFVEAVVLVRWGLRPRPGPEPPVPRPGPTEGAVPLGG